MKTNYLKIIVGLLMAISFMPTNAFAAGACYILVSSNRPCLGAPLPLTLFADSAPLANMSPKRCARRALEYHRFCRYKVGVDAVYSYFHSGRDWVGATGNFGGASHATYQINAMGHWEHIGTLVNN